MCFIPWFQEGYSKIDGALGWSELLNNVPFNLFNMLRLIHRKYIIKWKELCERKQDVWWEIHLLLYNELCFWEFLKSGLKKSLLPVAARMVSAQHQLFFVHVSVVSVISHFWIEEIKV